MHTVNLKNYAKLMDTLKLEVKVELNLYNSKEFNKALRYCVIKFWEKY
jgi:hypothetical protein